jgi:TatD DNase family protein
MIDTHAHLYLEEFKDDLNEVIQHSKDSGIGEIWLPAIDAASLNPMENLSSAWPGYFKLFAGLHPCEVRPGFEETLQIIFKSLENGHYTGIGEIGLDLYWDTTYFKEQKEALEIQLDKAVERNMPVILHIRDASEQIMPIIRGYYSKGLKGIFHSYAGNLEQAIELTNEGFLIGINGSITFKNSKLATFLDKIPISNIVTETDCPFLAPVPHRGKRNDPSYIPLIINKISELYNIPASEVEMHCQANASRLIS